MHQSHRQGGLINTRVTRAGSRPESGSVINPLSEGATVEKVILLGVYDRVAQGPKQRAAPKEKAAPTSHTSIVVVLICVFRCVSDFRRRNRKTPGMRTGPEPGPVWCCSKPQGSVGPVRYVRLLVRSVQSFLFQSGAFWLVRSNPLLFFFFFRCNGARARHCTEIRTGPDSHNQTTAKPGLV